MKIGCHRVTLSVQIGISTAWSLVIDQLMYKHLHFWFCFWQVERAFGATHSDPLEIEKAKRSLKVR